MTAPQGKLLCQRERVSRVVKALDVLRLGGQQPMNGIILKNLFPAQLRYYTLTSRHDQRHNGYTYMAPY